MEKDFRKRVLGSVIFVLIVSVSIWKYQAYESAKRLAEGWVYSTDWNCPTDHPIKANSKSMIYHVPNDPYWNRTDARNGKCFDTTDHASKQGFRASYGTPIASAVATSIKSYAGGYAPDGTFCNYGYSPTAKNCCDEDDYTCEMRDKAPSGATALCMDETYDFNQNQSLNCLQNGGVETDPQFSPFVKP